MSYRALLRQLLGGKPKPPAPNHLGYVPRGPLLRAHAVLSDGDAFLGAPATVITKLSPAEAARCFGVVQAGV